MAKTVAQKTYEESLQWLRANQFDVSDAPGTGNRVLLKKNGCAAEIEKSNTGLGRVFGYPGILVGGEVAKLVDGGYQKFLQTSKLKIAATEAHLKLLHRFTEELKEALGTTSLYNESLGSVSESCHYDRVKDRDLPTTERPKRPWQE